MEKYWQQALTFEQYMEYAEKKATETTETPDPNLEYYQLGLQRMNRTLKTYKISAEMLEQLKNKNFDGKILIISEPWCGDASATVPAVARFFEAAGVEVRVFLRDSDNSLIQQFLTDGSESIPKVLIINNDDTVRNTWGPRPAFGLGLLKKFKENPEVYPRETFYNDLQVYYAKNRGADAIQEIVELI